MVLLGKALNLFQDGPFLKPFIEGSMEHLLFNKAMKSWYYMEQN